MMNLEIHIPTALKVDDDCNEATVDWRERSIDVSTCFEAQGLGGLDVILCFGRQLQIIDCGRAEVLVRAIVL